MYGPSELNENYFIMQNVYTLTTEEWLALPTAFSEIGSSSGDLDVYCYKKATTRKVFLYLLSNYRDCRFDVMFLLFLAVKYF